MEFIIRPAGPGDAEDMNTMRRMPGTFENILGIPSESVENSRAFLSTLDSGSQHELAAVVRTAEGKDQVVGAAGLTVSTRARTRHSASFGIMVHTDYQGMGIGSALTQAILDLADNWLMLVRVELEVFTDNERAIRLYERLGFEKEGVRRKASIRGGQYVDEYMMSRLRHTQGV